MTTPNPATELAKERNRAAQERTLMAWIRTSLTLISFGFGIDSIVSILSQQLGGALNTIRLTRILSISFIALGTCAMLAATTDYRRQLRKIQRNDLLYQSRISPTLIVAYFLAVLGTVALFGIIMSIFVVVS